MTPVHEATIRVLIVDDEPPARQRLRSLLENRPGFEVVGEASNAQRGAQAIRHLAPDLAFLDIQMPDGTGFDVVEAVGTKAMPAVVFVTAFDRHALRAFEVHALDYLLKPFDDRRFQHALERAAEAIRRRRIEGLCGRLEALLASMKGSPSGNLEAPSSALEEPTVIESLGAGEVTHEAGPAKLAVRAAGRLRLVAVHDIDWIEAAGTYVRLHTGDRSLLLRQSLSQLERRLASHRFVRIHRSTLVQADRVREVRTEAHGDALVVLEDGTELRLSRSHRDRLGQLTGSV